MGLLSSLAITLYTRRADNQGTLHPLEGADFRHVPYLHSPR